MSVDVWGSPVQAGDPTTIDDWNEAWRQALHFVDDPFETLARANDADTAFALGSVFTGTYRLLGGARPNDAAVLSDLARAKERATSDTDRMHVQALLHMAAGNFTKAGRCWEDISAIQRDFAAIRFAHDVYLHVGDEARRLRSSQRAFDSWGRTEAGWGFLAGQLSFALEEAGIYDEAEVLGREALALDPLDLWSRHALAHLYEALDDSDAAFSLLTDDQDVWTAQEGLAVHIWWHLALRLIGERRYDEALAIHDAQQSVATTPFRMCDLASLLWRLELVGVEVGDRWDVLADRFAERPEWHMSGFLDLHGAFIYTRRPNHDHAERFFSGVANQYRDGTSENADTFNNIVQPLVSSIRGGASNPADAIVELDQIADSTHRIGGSIAQRDIIDLTRSHYVQQAQLHDDAPEAT